MRVFLRTCENLCEEYTRHLNSLRRAQDCALRDAKAEKDKLTRERAHILKAIREGIEAKLVRDDLERIAARLEVLEDQIAEGHKEARPLLHPAMARRYREEVAALRETLSRSGGQGEAVEHLRGRSEGRRERGRPWGDRKPEHGNRENGPSETRKAP